MNDGRRNQNPNPECNDCCFAWYLGISIFILLIYLISFPFILDRAWHQVPYFSISGFDISSFNDSSPSSSEFSLNFTIRNPDLTQINYDDIFVSVYYDNSLLTKTSLYPFEQRKNDITQIKARLMANIDGILSERISKADGVMEFQVRVLSPVTIKRIHYSRVELRVFCDIGIVVKFNNSTLPIGSMAGPMKDCRLDILQDNSA